MASKSLFRLIRQAFLASFLASVPSGHLSASFFFSEALPNTSDDANLESVSISNASCVPESLSGHVLSDTSGKTFLFGPTAVIPSISSVAFFRPETKITLNNENETLFLRSPSWDLLDSFFYATSSKSIPVLRTPAPIFPICVEPAQSVETSAPEPEIPVSTEDVSSDEILPEEVPEPAVSETGSSDTAELPPVESEWADSQTGTSVQESVQTQSGETYELPVSGTGRAFPEYLRIVDSDGDRRFDQLRITYSEAVTGSAILSEIFLYSDTGGLFESKIATASGFFSDSALSGSVLTLVLTGNVLQKETLRVDGSVSSQLRLKSASEFGLQTISSNLPVTPFGLTTSFSEYAKDRISFFPEPSVPLPSATPPSFSAISLGGSSPTISPPPVPTVSTGASSVKTDPKPLPSLPKKRASKKPNPSDRSETASGTILPQDLSDAVGIAIIPSTWVDLLPSGKFRYECFSKTCPVSFRVEKESEVSGYWLFPDGRKRYGSTTGTIGKAAGRYRLSYVASKQGFSVRKNIDLSIVPVSETADATISASASVGTKKLAASKSSVQKPSPKTVAVNSKNSSKAPAATKSKGADANMKASVLEKPSTDTNFSESGSFFIALATVSCAALVALFLWNAYSSRAEGRSKAYEMDPVETEEPK